MDNDSFSDDEIVLLNPPAGDESNIEGEIGDHESSVNPALFLRRGPSDDSNINPASVHALQTACTSLQHKLNDKTKKYNELYQKNKIMQKALYDMNRQEHVRQPGGMDDLCQQEPSIVHAAGAGAGACSVEDEGAIAEQRAKQGYISHLEREVLRNTSAIARGNEEIQRLKRTVDERDREKKSLLQRVDQLQAELDRTSRTYEDNMRTSQRNVEELEKQHQYLFQENMALKEKIEALDRNSSKDGEIKDLKSKLVVAEKEMTKLTLQYREMDRRSQEKEEELSRLKAQCNQYEIEADINRKHRQSEGSDEVDGDSEELIRALDMIRGQRSEVTSLMTQVQQQKKVIKDLLIANERDCRPVGADQSTTKEERGIAQGASISHYVDESCLGNRCNDGRYTNIGAPVQEQISSQIKRDISPITRRQSDRGDYRGTSRQPIATSPRLREQFVPTGSTHIPEMLANEDTRMPHRNVGTNVFDSGSPGPRLSPRSHAHSPQPPVIPVSHISPRTHAQSPQPLYMNIAAANSPDSQRRETSPNVNVESQNSPRTRNEHHRNVEFAMVQPVSQVHVMPSSNNGARPKQSYSQDDMAQTRLVENNTVAQNRIPDRMTQSAILLRDDSNNTENIMSRSLFSPNSTLETATRASPERNEFPGTVKEPVWIRPENPPEPIYGNNYRVTDNGPDYENIVNIKPHSSARRQVEEHEETVFVNDLTGVNQTDRTGDNTGTVETSSDNIHVEGSLVSALKICPVCNLEYSRLTMDQFQTHVFECFDNCEEPTTLQPAAAANDDDRNCPMCGEVFPLTISQETYEQHVLAHFGEEPMMERFEMINS